DEFGSSVALSRYAAVVGAPLHNAVGNNSGAAYVFSPYYSVWSQSAELLSNDLAPFDDFGRAVAIHGDTAVVGAPLHNAVGSDSGAAYVFRKVYSTWVQEAKLLPSDLAPLDNFGASVAISKDTIVVGAPLRNDVGDNSGTAYVFTRSYSTWTQQAKLTPLDLAPLDEFGRAVAIYKDTIVVGAPLHNQVGDNSGAAYVFHRDGGKWKQEARIIPHDLAPLDHFGASVDVDGNSIIAGSPLRNDVGDNSGAAYLFRRYDWKWRQEAKITAADLAPLDSFGTSVGLSWESAIVGSPFRNDVGNNSGAAYVLGDILDRCKGDAMYDYAMYGDDEYKDECDDAPPPYPGPPPGGGGGGGGVIIIIRVNLLGTGADADATAAATFRAEGGDVRFELSAKRLAAGDYDVMVSGEPSATLAVSAAEAGKLQIEESAAAPPEEPGAGFDPRGKRLEVCQGDTTYLTVDFPATVEEARQLARGVRIRTPLESMTEGSAARGTIEFRSRQGRDQVKLNLRDVEDGLCTLRVGGVEVAEAEVVRGKARLDFDSVPGKAKLPLGFDPRGQLVQVLQEGEVALQVIFPLE
ncbi:MAG: FG-GAP repeat protein, partial [Deltaproteobacteria bacterium]|nr:FG-GAP repeat protein [Deltaproteobacteria bacterium]